MNELPKIPGPPADTGEAPARVRALPIGAEVSDRGTDFRVWGPRASSLELMLQVKPGSAFERFDMEPEDAGYYRLLLPQARRGMRYKFATPAGAFPDPASRFQPEGPHGPSEIVDPAAFEWTDHAWKGVSAKRQVIYEMHLGTFTRQGTWTAAIEQLPALAELGVTVLELMPVADFPGAFGWGYDGVNLFAPTRLYGRPEEFSRFVNRAHELGLGVILDVVYNHLGPDGNYLNEYSPDYFTDRYQNEWGEAINFDGENSGPVREFFLANAAYWIREFHLDGLRLDATQQIFDASEDHIVAALARAARGAAGLRQIYLVGENEPQQTRLVRPATQGGYALDALWNDDFHHSAVAALTGRTEAYYTDYQGAPQEFISAAKYGYLYQGQWYRWQKKGRGSPTFGLPSECWINYLQNHDQVANSLRGLRIHQLASPAKVRALTAFLLLCPGTPMLFQGQEFAASAPFLYFADHNPELTKLVAKGRREFLRQFPSIGCAESEPYLAKPGSPETFERSKLDFSERAKNREVYELHGDLLTLRREDAVFSRGDGIHVDGAVISPEAFLLRFFGEVEGDRLLLVNLGRDLDLSPAPEPLLAPPEGRDWQVLWSSELPQYGGCGTPPFSSDEKWRVVSNSAVVLEPADGSRSGQTR